MCFSAGCDSGASVKYGTVINDDQCYSTCFNNWAIGGNILLTSHIGIHTPTPKSNGYNSQLNSEIGFALDTFGLFGLPRRMSGKTNK